MTTHREYRTLLKVYIYKIWMTYIYKLDIMDCYMLYFFLTYIMSVSVLYLSCPCLSASISLSLSVCLSLNIYLSVSVSVCHVWACVFVYHGIICRGHQTACKSQFSLLNQDYVYFLISLTCITCLI